MHPGSGHPIEILQSPRFDPIQDWKISIGCPEPGCKARLYSDDVRRIGTFAQHAQFMELIKADYRVRLLEVYSAGGFEGVIQDPQSRPCPQCRVILHRSSGCDDFICNCGHRFHFTQSTWPTVTDLEAEIGIGEQAAPA